MVQIHNCPLCKSIPSFLTLRNCIYEVYRVRIACDQCKLKIETYLGDYFDVGKPEDKDVNKAIQQAISDWNNLCISLRVVD